MEARAPRRAAPAHAEAKAKATATAKSGAKTKAAQPAAEPATRLKRYAAKRDFAKTPEPEGDAAAGSAAPGFVVQKHWARRLHYDFRLELDGVLLSWAVPKGPSFDPADKRIAIHVEDHPVAYGGFEGTIPAKQYGAGTVIVWDRGTWSPVGDPHAGLAQGKLVFELHGEKLAGRWELVRIAKPQDKQDAWMLFKKRDAWARPSSEYDVVAALPDSVVEHPLGPVELREPRGAVPADVVAAVAASAPLRPQDLPGAVAASLPPSFAPQLATAADSIPAGAWSYEIKLDGYRLLARVEKRQVRLYTRAGNDWTSKMKTLAAEVAALGLGEAWLDGEIVVMNARGVPDFNALQNAIDSSSSGVIDLFVFDLPFLGGYDLRAAPLEARRALLRQRLEGHRGEHLRFSESFAADPASLLESARAMGLEGIVAKRADAPYVQRRSTTWLKLKCRQRQEFVIGGYTDRAGAVGEVGSLMLGVHDASGRLRYAGNVGSGWDAATAAKLHEALREHAAAATPFGDDDTQPGRWSKRSAGTERWVEPVLVAEVSYADWTPEDRVRHAVFLGLRLDKPAREVVREVPGEAAGEAASEAPGRTARATKGRSAPPAAAPRLGAAGASRAAPAPAAKAGGKRVALTHPERVVDPSTGLTKRDLVRYYEGIAERMLPHLKGRPASLVRGPSGIGGTLFFQKHIDPAQIPGVRELDASLWPGHGAMIEIPSAEALVNAAQLNVIEFHTWNATVKARKPDRIVFDLDPGEGLAWPRVQEAALLTHTLLGELGLQAWLKTSGGKGLHVVVPLAPRLDAEIVKDFSRAVVQHLAKTVPSRFVAKSGAANRVGRVFVDYLRNGRAATTAAAFSARSRPGLGVSMPVSWEQLPELKGGGQWTIATARDYLSFQKLDPWAGYWASRQTLGGAMKRLGYRPPRAAADAPEPQPNAAGLNSQ